MIIYSWFTYYKWWFSIAMLVYQWVDSLRTWRGAWRLLRCPCNKARLSAAATTVMARGGRDQFPQALVAGAESVDSNHSQVITIYNIIWLVVWNMNFIFPYLGKNHPNWRTHIFQRGWNHQPIQTNPQSWLLMAVANIFSKELHQARANASAQSMVRMARDNGLWWYKHLTTCKGSLRCTTGSWGVQYRMTFPGFQVSYHGVNKTYMWKTNGFPGLSRNGGFSKSRSVKNRRVSRALRQIHM